MKFKCDSCNGMLVGGAWAHKIGCPNEPPTPKMKFTLEIELGNEAMQTGDDIRAALNDHVTIASDNATVGDGGLIRNLYGKVVGKWEVTDTPAADGWISVEQDPHPTYSWPVLISFDLNEQSRGFVTEARWEHGRWEWNSPVANQLRKDSDVKAWKPLPKGYDGNPAPMTPETAAFFNAAVAPTRNAALIEAAKEAEKLNTPIPVEKNHQFNLCYVFILGNEPGKRIGIVKFGEQGYYPCEGYDYAKNSLEDCQEYVDLLNSRMEIPSDVVESMRYGSMFGWDCPAAKRAKDYFTN